MLSNEVWKKTVLDPLHARRMTLTALAELHGINPTIMRALRLRTNRKAERTLSSFLGVPVEKLFPDRYPIEKHRILSSKYAALLASQKSSASSDMENAA